MNYRLFTAVLLCLCQLTSCQTDKSFKVIPFSAETNIAEELEHVSVGDEHRLSGDANLYFSRFAGDTTTWCALSENEDTLFVESTHLASLQAIPLDNIPKHIESIYYHNHDSIFVFYDRIISRQKTEERANLDFILIDGTGKKIRSYSLDGTPNIRNDRYQHNALSLYHLSDIPDRIMDGKMLLCFAGSNPSVIEQGYGSFNPPLVALYDLATGKSQMLNIRIPHEMLEKKYDIVQHLSWIRKSEDGNLIIGFRCSPCIFKYDMRKDTMILASKRCSNTFLNVDSASMEKDRNYMSFDFSMPLWAPAYSCYFRDICVMHCEGYKPYARILEMLDANFNHIAYLIGNKEYETPYFNLREGKLVTYNRASHRPHYAHLTRKQQYMNMQDWRETSLEKLPPRKKDAMKLQDYLQKMQIQEGSLVLIINLKYPCGHCLDYLFSTMEQHKDAYAAHNIYYITYDPDCSSLTDDILKRHRLKGAKNILQDNYLLDNVYILNKSMGEGQYFLIDYRSIDPNHIRVVPMDFSELQSNLAFWTKQQMEKE